MVSRGCMVKRKCLGNARGESGFVLRREISFSGRGGVRVSGEDCGFVPLRLSLLSQAELLPGSPLEGISRGQSHKSCCHHTARRQGAARSRWTLWARTRALGSEPRGLRASALPAAFPEKRGLTARKRTEFREKFFSGTLKIGEASAL